MSQDRSHLPSRGASRCAYNRLPVFLSIAISLLTASLPALAADNAAVTRFKKDVQPLLERYCYACHGDGGDKGNVAFDQLTTDDQILDHTLWLKALKNLRAGMMPPRGEDVPTAAEMKAIETWIKRDAFNIDPADPDPGRVTLRRLNRTEYRNTIRDLMGYDFDVTAAFPPDDTGSGFDNIASVLSISPMLLDKYMQAADKIVKAAVPDTTRVAAVHVLTGRDFVPNPTISGNEGRDNPTDARVNIGVAAKYPATVHIDKPGEYRVRAHFAVIGQFEYDLGHANILFSSDGEQKYKGEHVWEDEKHGKEVVVEFNRNWQPGDKAFEFEVAPLPPVGSEAQVQVIAQAQAANAAQAALDQAAAAETAGVPAPAQAAQQSAAGNQDPNAAQDPAAADPAAAQGRGFGRGRGAGAAGAAGGFGGRRGGGGTRVALRIVDVRIEGPLDKSQWVHPANYEKFFPKAEPPVETAQRREYAREVLKPFATRALRRPVDDRTLDRLVSLAESVYTEPDKTFEQGIQQAMIAVLSSPRFLFRIEETIPSQANPAKVIPTQAIPSQTSNQIASPLDEYALASRISYLLWSSMPDEELFQLAQRGELRKNLDAQVKRMLADKKSDALVESFSGQWLRTREVDTVAIDARWVLARDKGTEAEERAADEAAAAAAAARRGGRGNFQAGNFQQGQAQQGQAPVQGAAAENAQPPAAQGAAAAPDANQPAANAAPAQQDSNAAPQGGRGRGGRGRGGRGLGNNAAAQQPNANAQAAAPDVAAPAPDAQASQAPAQAAVANQDPLQQAAAVAADPNQPAAAAAIGARGNRGNRGAAGAGFARGGRRGGGGTGKELDKDLRAAMHQETEQYFGYVMHADRSVLELVDSNYTFLNEKLANFYEIKADVTGPEMRKVELPPDSHRGGILTQGSVLTITSQSTRTSAVKRGLFLLDNFLGAPAPPPPPDVPPLESAEKSFHGKEPTLRETLELHRANPVCASCHQRMDPLGLALENYNALGLWRTKERGQDIVVEGQLITGEKLSSIEDLKKILTGPRRLDYYRCLTQKLMIYALGRDLDYYDVEAVDQIVDRLDKDNGRFSTLLMGVIESAPFQKRRNVVSPPADSAPREQAMAQ